MEESIIKSDSHIEGISKDNLTYDIWKSLGLKEVSPRQLSPLVLAYIGDSIFDLVVKTMIVTKGNTQVNKMNRMASSIVKAEDILRISWQRKRKVCIKEAAMPSHIHLLKMLQ